MPHQHDPLYKELIQALFKDFMKFAIEDLYQLIDYQTVKFLSKIKKKSSIFILKLNLVKIKIFHLECGITFVYN